MLVNAAVVAGLMNLYANLGPIDSGCYKSSVEVCRIEKLIVDGTNRMRRAAPLAADAHLSFIARQWSQAQAERASIGHEGFPQQRRDAYSQEFGGDEGIMIRAENVAYNMHAAVADSEPAAQALAEKFVQQWWNSPGHRRNMQGEYTLLGVGVVQGPAPRVGSYGQRWYATQIFATRSRRG